MNWMVKHNKLDEHQLAVLDGIRKKPNGRFWIRGFAGTGKSILLIHALTEYRTAHPDASIAVVVFTHALRDMLASGIPAHLGAIPVVTYPAFCKNPGRYDLILVDEVQDLKSDVLETLKTHAGALIAAGDEEQAIWQDRGLSASQIAAILDPAVFHLSILYRITPRLLRIVRAILPDSRIVEAKVGGQAVNVDIALAKAAGPDAETDWVWRRAREYAASQPGEAAAILLPDKNRIKAFVARICRAESRPVPEFPDNAWDKPDFNPVNRHLAEQSLPLRYIGNGYGSLDEAKSRPLVFLMTYHSAKGLDFETVFLPFLNEDTRFWRDNDAIDRALFFVGCTRSRRNLFLSYHAANPHPYVQAMPQEHLKRLSCEPPAPPNARPQPVPVF